MLNQLVVTKLYARLGNMYNPKMTFNMSSVAMCSKTITIPIFSSKFGVINDQKCFLCYDFNLIKAKHNGDPKFVLDITLLPTMYSLSKRPS